METKAQPGEFLYEQYYSQSLKRWQVYWQYREPRGRLYAGITKTLLEAEEKAEALGWTGKRPVPATDITPEQRRLDAEQDRKDLYG